jgi:hypothetical protein
MLRARHSGYDRLLRGDAARNAATLPLSTNKTELGLLHATVNGVESGRTRRVR